MRRAAGTALCVLAWLLAALVAWLGAAYLFGTILWMHAPVIPALAMGVALAALPLLLCRACYRIGVRLRRSAAAAQ
jgi:hypothetical protein